MTCNPMLSKHFIN